MKAKTKLTKLLSILLALVMVVGLLPTTALAEEPDAFLQFADAPGEFFYDISGGYNSEGPTVDTIFTLTEPTMITGIWTYHWNAANYDIDFSKQTIQLKDTNTDTVVYSGAVRIGHHVNTRDCDWIVLPNIVLPVGTYQVIDSHNESWCALNSKGVCMVKGYSTTYTVTFDANGGTGTMADVAGVSGEYTLPANGFTAPEGKQFKCWNVGGAEKAVGDKITVTANITVTAVWENIPAGPCVNHKPNTAVKENIKNATCKAEGSYDSVVYCSVCNSEISRTPKVIPKSSHKYDAGKVTKAATCKATGIKTYTCTVCKATETKTIAKKAHTYKNYVTKATLTANGKIVNKCSVCGVVKSTTAVPLVKTFTISATNYNYDGKVKTPAVTVKDSKGKTLKKNTDYTVSYAKGRKNVGKYAVKVTLKGNYAGTKTLYFNINPKGTTIAKLTPKSKSLTVQWKKQTNQTTGYQIQYSTASNFSGAKTITMLKNTYYAKSITGLAGNKRYYVRIRTYKKVGNTNYYSPWSSAKSVTTKK